jgi:hypothetical protein
VADRFDGSLEDVFDLQDKVAISAAGVIEPTLQAAEIRRSSERPTRDLTAYDLYLRALANYPWTGREQMLKALDLFEQAAARDPGFAPALAWDAVCHIRLWLDGNTEDPEKGEKCGRTSIHQKADHDLDRKNHQECQRGAEQHGKRDDRELKASHRGGAATPAGSVRAGSLPDRGSVPGCRQSVRRRNQPMTSTIQKVSMGVSTTAARG